MTGPEGTLPAGVRPLIADDPPAVGEYPLLGRLGSGGMGVVYLGHHPDHGLVAVKVLRSSYAGESADEYASESGAGHGERARSSGSGAWHQLDPSRPWDVAQGQERRDRGAEAVLTVTEELRRRFRAEADYARRVASCATARVIEDGTATVRPYIVTEYIQGPALHEVVGRQGPLPDGMLEAVALGVMAALTAIHRTGLLHRDLKPANVLLARTGPRVIDFGLAAEADIAGGPTRIGMVMGSTGWIAPERLAGRPATAASDMFGWGCLVAYAGTGRHPFGGGSGDEITERIVHGEPDLDGLTPLLRAPVAAALQKEPRLRPQAGDLLRTLLVPLLDGHTPAPDDDLERIAATLIAKIWRPPADLGAATEAWPPARAQAQARKTVGGAGDPAGTTVMLSGADMVSGVGGPGVPGGTETAALPRSAVRGRHTRPQEPGGRGGAFGWAAAGWTAAAVVLVAGMAYGLDAAGGDNEHRHRAPAIVSPDDSYGQASPGPTGIGEGGGPASPARSPKATPSGRAPVRSKTPVPSSAPAPVETTSPPAPPAPAVPGQPGRTRRPHPKKTPEVFTTG